MNDEFYTMKGYQQNGHAALTSAMEDYLEMMCRILEKGDKIRVAELSEHLHVKPPSVSKMLKQLDREGFVRAEKYGMITVTEKGISAGKYLLYRHNVIHSFLCALNESENELEEAEKIEHFLSEKTVKNLDALTKRLKSGE